MIEQEQPRGHPQRAARATRGQTALMVGFAVLVLVGLGVFVIRTVSQPRLTGITRADAGNPALVAAGRQLYLTRCAGCHGTSGEGASGWRQRAPDDHTQAPPIDASGPMPQRSDAWLFGLIKQGGQPAAAGTPSAMPGFGTALSDSEIWALVSYIKQTWPPALQTAQPAQ